MLDFDPHDYLGDGSPAIPTQGAREHSGNFPHRSTLGPFLQDASDFTNRCTAATTSQQLYRFTRAERLADGHAVWQSWKRTEETPILTLLPNKQKAAVLHLSCFAQSLFLGQEEAQATCKAALRTSLPPEDISASCRTTQQRHVPEGLRLAF